MPLLVLACFSRHCRSWSLLVVYNKLLLHQRTVGSLAKSPGPELLKQYLAVDVSSVTRDAYVKTEATRSHATMRRFVALSQHPGSSQAPSLKFPDATADAELLLQALTDLLNAGKSAKVIRNVLTSDTFTKLKDTADVLAGRSRVQEVVAVSRAWAGVCA